MMKKLDAIALFGSTGETARALGISLQALYQWPEQLSQKRADWVTGAALRLGRLKSKAESAPRNGTMRAPT